MIVTLVTQNAIHSISLPEKVRGQYWLHDSTAKSASSNLIGIEGINGEWVIKSNNKATLADKTGKSVRNVVLRPLDTYNLTIHKTKEKTNLYVEPITEDRQRFHKYWVDRNVVLRIGRQDNNDIIIPNQYVSSTHAQLVYNQGQWSVMDASTNGTFVNGVRISSQNLRVGDVVSIIMGFKVIIGSSYIAFNNPDGKVAITTNAIWPFVKPKSGSQGQRPDADDDGNEFNLDGYIDTFSRSPRFKRAVEKPTYSIDSPPPSGVGEETPIMLVIGPAITMALSSMTMMSFTVMNALSKGEIGAATPSIVMAGSMLLGSLLWPTLSRRHEKKKKEKKEILRQTRYREYLGHLNARFAEDCAKQEKVLRETFVPLDNCLVRIQNVQRNLWERGPGQTDFLRLRIGIGNDNLVADINYQDRRFVLEDDNLQEELYALCEAPKPLRNVPLTLPLFEEYISGVIGDRRQVVEFAKGLIFQLAALYSYDEVKLVFLYDPEEEGVFRFTKWLPHVWNKENTIRFIATDPNEVKEISAFLEREIVHRSSLDDMENVEPQSVIFSFSTELSQRAEMLKQIYTQKKNLRMSVLAFYDKLKNLPKECTTVVELEGYGGGASGELSRELSGDVHNAPAGSYAGQYPGGAQNGNPSTGKLFNKEDSTGSITPFMPDIFVKADPAQLSIRLANIRLDTLANVFKLPRMITFLELFGVGKIEHLNPLTRWQDNDPTKTLEAAVGVDTLGGSFMLDLHEKFHGPHGLVAGMTGSGKSEFIMTYILSLAINYHPHEVAFILIDYKGGGMAKSFETLPHTAGIITNLDGNAINRSLVSIQSELKRRQAIFAEASKQLDISNIDIYRYQKLYRERAVSEPLQHLILIADEFAELKTQQPEFMTQLVSAARIGRSLGVHLILATQKPAGVVDDQIWSNSRFRVCLKVQDRADSQDMLKRPDAAELTDTGRFYLQVGYNELFEMGQSAWAGAPYYPADKVVAEKDDSVVVIDRNGRPIREAKPDKKRAHMANPRKQMDAITDLLSSLAEEENIKIRPLWLEPLAPVILLDDIKKRYAASRSATESFILNPVIGEYDDPARQQQCALTLPLSAEGNVIIYGSAGNGKTTFLNALVYSLMQDHTPEDVNIYLLDFSAETLRAFAQAPHVGDVVFAFEKDKIDNLFKMLVEELASRKKLFADYGGDYISYMRAGQARLPNIVIAIQNYSAFTEIYDSMVDTVTYLTREGTKYGIYFILTALGVNVVRFNQLQNFKQLFALQLNDPGDYSTVVGRTNGLVPSKQKGSGLVKLDEIYEFQIAHITEDPVPFTFIRSQCQALSQYWQGQSAPGIPLLPEQVDAQFLSGHIQTHKPLSIPIGVECDSLKVHTYPFGRSYINLTLSSSNESHDFLYDLAHFITGPCGIKVTVIDNPGNFAKKDISPFTYATQQKDCESAVEELFDVLLYRNNTYKEALKQGVTLEPFDLRIGIITNYSALKDAMAHDETLQQKLAAVMERGDTAFNMILIVADQAQNMSMVSANKWFKKHVSADNAKDGIWVGSGITSQYQLEIKKQTPDMREDLPYGFGYVVRQGKAVKLKMLCSEMREPDSDN
jgi:S-DNA-T family DNA segregation ATPase FtsK/SpoIIIE